MRCSHIVRIFIFKSFWTMAFAFALVFTAGVSHGDSGPAPPDQEVQALLDQGWSRLTNMDKHFDGLYEAIDLYNRVVQIDPDNKVVYWKLAEVKFKIADEIQDKDEKEKMFKESMEAAEKSIAKAPGEAGGYYWLGCCQVRLAEMANIFKAVGYVNRGIENLRKAIAVDPDHRCAVLARAVLAGVYTEAPWPIGDSDKAEAYAREAVQMDPGLTLARLWLAKVYAHKKEYGKALEEAEKCLSVKNPTYPWDSRLYDWPAARALQQELEGKG